MIPMEVVRLSSKYQISVPKVVRERLRLQAGQEFVVLTKGDTVLLVPRTGPEALRGVMAGASTENIRDRRDRV